MEKTKWSENVILVQADYADQVTHDLRVNYQRMLGRAIPQADLAHWLVCAALDGGVKPGKNEVHVVLIHSKENKQMSQFVPSVYQQELDGQGFDDPHMGSFSISALQIENLVSGNEFFLQAFETLADAQEIRNLIVVPDWQQVGPDMEKILEKVDPEKENAVVLTMEPHTGKTWKNEILGYSLTSALGVHAEEFK